MHRHLILCYGAEKLSNHTIIAKGALKFRVIFEKRQAKHRSKKGTQTSNTFRCLLFAFHYVSVTNQIKQFTQKLCYPLW